MNIIEIEGNIFDFYQNYDALAHCISEDYAMGAGIAKTFKTLFPELCNLKKEKFKGVATLSVLRNDHEFFIFNLITKERFFQKPTYETLECTLIRLKELCKEKKIKKLAMPKIGCGLDRLSYKKVKEMIINIFKNQEIEITIFYIIEKK